MSIDDLHATIFRRLRHKVTIPFVVEQGSRLALYSWCDKNIGEIGGDWDYKYCGGNIEFRFKNQTDAVEFKLRFG